jgi:hypothetical protein
MIIRSLRRSSRTSRPPRRRASCPARAGLGRPYRRRPGPAPRHPGPSPAPGHLPGPGRATVTGPAFRASPGRHRAAGSPVRRRPQGPRTCPGARPAPRRESRAVFPLLPPSPATSPARNRHPLPQSPAPGAGSSPVSTSGAGSAVGSRCAALARDGLTRRAGGGTSIRRRKARRRISAVDCPNGTVGYRNCLNTWPGRAVQAVGACLSCPS